MAKGESEKEDNQRGKAARAKGDQSSAGDTDGSSRAPSRVHIFKDKGNSSSVGSSKSGDEPLRCSPFGTNRLAGFSSTSNAAIVSAAQPRVIDFSEQWIRLKHQIEKGKKVLYDAAMKAEDFEG